MTDDRMLITKIIMFALHPLSSYAGLRFARTGTQLDYWRHQYWICGSAGMADIIIAKDKLITYYCEQAFRLRYDK